ncbi:MAG: ferrous iron transport protein A [Mollicutes bacterium]|nr:ferrous iron transport protein A [Mollicutes bacterium]
MIINKLNDCNINDQFIIRYLDGAEAEKRRLQNLGFIPSSIIKVINITDDNMIVLVFDSRIAINKEVCNNIRGTILERNSNQKRIQSRYKKHFN